jgi:hypothetical protein
VASEVAVGGNVKPEKLLQWCLTTLKAIQQLIRYRVMENGDTLIERKLERFRAKAAGVKP